MEARRIEQTTRMESLPEGTLKMPRRKTNLEVQLSELSQQLCRLSYNDIEECLKSLDPDSLVLMINVRSRKVADRALSLLWKKGGHNQAVIEAILAGKMTHRDAKVRATAFLLWQGRACTEAIQAYLHLLNDANEDVADTALFGVVFMQDSLHIPVIERRRDLHPTTNWLRSQLETAIQALRERNPFMFSPGFKDEANRWNLNEKPWERV